MGTKTLMAWFFGNEIFRNSFMQLSFNSPPTHDFRLPPWPSISALSNGSLSFQNQWPNGDFEFSKGAYYCSSSPSFYFFHSSKFEFCPTFLLIAPWPQLSSFLWLNSPTISIIQSQHFFYFSNPFLFLTHFQPIKTLLSFFSFFHFDLN